MIVFFLITQILTFAQSPFSAENVQLQRLINKSEEQIKSLKQVLKYSKQDAASLEKAARILEEMSSGIDKSIEKYQGTKTYEKALIELQSKDDFKSTYADSERMRNQYAKQEVGGQDALDTAFVDLVKFQKESVKANASDLSDQEKLQQALLSGQQGFIPKIQAQAQLGSWQANTRVSSQLTELLAAVHAVREELRALRLNEGNSSAVGTLVNGAEIQNQKQREGSNR